MATGFSLVGTDFSAYQSLGLSADINIISLGRKFSASSLEDLFNDSLTNPSKYEGIAQSGRSHTINNYTVSAVSKRIVESINA